MLARQEIKRLCESWWERLAKSAKSEQHTYAEQLLKLLGWNTFEPMGLAVEAAHPSARSYLLRGKGQTALAAHFLMPGALEPPSTVVERGLDFCESTRVLVSVTGALHIRYAFITDLFRSYLYDAHTEELLLCADSPADFDRDLLGVLGMAEVEQGSLDDIRRSPRSAVARHLREWCHRWHETLMAEGHVSEQTAWLAVDRLIMLRCFIDQDVLKRNGVQLKRRFMELFRMASEPRPYGCGTRLTSLIHDLWFDRKAGLLSPEPTLDAAMERDSIVAPMLREFNLLSRTKFTIPVILESFNYGDAAEKARVRMIPEDDEERAAYLAKQTSATIDTARVQIDVEDEGYRAIFHWFDRLVSAYERLTAEFDTEAYHAETTEDMDLFAWSELDATRPSALSDRFKHAIEQGLVILYASDRQYRTARLMLYLHLIHRYSTGKIRFTRFPNLEIALQPRPHMTDADRKRLFQQAQEDEWDVI